MSINQNSSATRIVLAFIFAGFFSLHTLGQSSTTAGTGTLRGTVTLGGTGKPIHNALITILQLKRTVGTDSEGKYQIEGVPAGRYDIVAHLDRVPDIVRTTNLTTGENTVNFQFELTGV